MSDFLGDDGAATAVKPQVVKHALKAVRDAVAAVYARPVLSRAEYPALIGPWTGRLRRLTAVT